MAKIYNEESNTLLSGTSGNESTFNKAVFSGGKLTLSIKGGGKVIFDNVTSASEFNINNETYHIAEKRLVK
ncbi:MAG: hypothetical protein IKZ53_00835 [Selenomonadaceae bacterium]|nr:hypothetical protein [Selenomonadaceae bacterium]